MSNSTQKNRAINIAYHRSGRMVKRTPSDTSADMLMSLNGLPSSQYGNAQDKDEKNIHVITEQNGSYENKTIETIDHAFSSNQDNTTSKVLKQAAYINQNISIRIAARNTSENQLIFTEEFKSSREIVFSPVYIKGNRQHTALFVADVIHPAKDQGENETKTVMHRMCIIKRYMDVLERPETRPKQCFIHKNIKRRLTLA